MDTFTLLLQIFFVWGAIIAKIVLSTLIYTKSKNQGWLLLIISFSVELFAKILAVGLSFWIRELVSMDDLTTFSTVSDVISTLLAIVYHGLAVAGVFVIFNKVNKYISSAK